MTTENKNAPGQTSGGEAAAPVAKSVKGILCAKCNHVNRAGSTKCSRCESHLHIKCNDCGARNERIYSRCQTCGRRLHKSTFEKINARMFMHTAKITPVQMLLLIVTVAIVVFVVISLNHVKLPK